VTRFVIRLVDISLALVLFVIAAVPMAFIAALIRIHDGGPALFRQTRIGRDGHRFTVFKFRSMRLDEAGAGDGVVGPGDESIEEANARFKRSEPGDPRITPLGRLLRPSHLDELPQIFNILLGDMSFVGVRPDTPVQEADYSPEYWRLRHRYKPGLTGPAQLRSDPLTFDQRNSEESRWIEGYGVGMYFVVLVRTLGKVLRRSSF
jgi:lipopolysaccharide/colanic/teichoic acid biosynthesis glycosyltransferase